MRVAIVGGDNDLVGSFATALDRRGAASTALTASTAAAIQAELESARQSLGETPVVLRIGLLAHQLVTSPLAETDSEQWARRAEQPLRDAFHFHQATPRFLADTGGRIIVVLPTTGLSGSPGAVALATACEGERSLVKAQARVVGVHDITVNCIAVAPELLAAPAELERGGLPPRAIATPGLDQLADLVVAMAGPGFAGITGQTIALDGGRWMAP